MLEPARRRPLLTMMSLLALGSAGCATSGAVPRPFPGAPVVAVVPDKADASASATDGATEHESNTPEAPIAPDLRARRLDGRAVAEFALGFRGVPYRMGGADPAGFDCSGLVQYVFAQYGISVPRVVEQQYAVGDKIKPAAIKPGDLIFFNTTSHGRSASHVGIAIGKDRFVHAPNSTGVVRVEALSSAYWGGRYVGARRITVQLADFSSKDKARATESPSQSAGSPQPRGT